MASPPTSGQPSSHMAHMLLNPKAMQKQKSRAQGRSENTNGMSATASASTPQFDPRMLLNPKNFQHTSRSKPQDNVPPPQELPHTPSSHPGLIAGSSPTIPPSTPQDLQSNMPGMGGMIERIHNVSRREERPIKRQRIEPTPDDSDDKKSRAFPGGGKGGEIGEYMRKKREEGMQQNASKNSIVDLTADDEDDLVVVSDSGDVEVCFGQVEAPRVQAHRVPDVCSIETQQWTGQWPSIKVELRRQPRSTHIISVIDPRGNDIGNIDVRTAIGLAPLMDNHLIKLRCQARLATRKIKPGEYPGQSVSEYYDLILNLYGRRVMATGVGRHLSQKQVWLRAPFMVDKGIEVVNPHTPKVLPRTSLNGSSGYSAGYVNRTVEEIRNDVIGIFDSLEESETLPEMEADDLIITPLLPHQKQALYFMTDKEKERVYDDQDDQKKALWKLRLRPNGQRMYYNVITGKEVRAKPPEVLGGILADMMGLGKTLSILSLISSSLEDAVSFSEQKPPLRESDEEFPLICNSKATLLISPLSTIANWEEQIKMHVLDQGLSYYVFHGTNRCNNVVELSKYDIVITTYSVVSSEFDRRSKKRQSSPSPLEQTNWFRIVLDEAHMIREQSTRQSRAVCSLSAQRRWAVTGTPVQNRLDDLGALIKFLRVKPFDEKSGFTQFILSPFKNADPEILPKLRLLVDSFTLRRLKDRIDLPPRHNQIARLEFSPEEQQLYEWFAKDSDNAMRVVASGKKSSLGGKVYVHILRAILRLRLICAHGKELLSEEDMKAAEGMSKNNAIDLEDDSVQKSQLTPKQAYDMFSLMKESNADSCSQCDHKIAPKDMAADDSSSAKDDVIGYMTPCYQILCRDCITAFKALERQKVNSEGFVVCPLCDQYVRMSYFEIKQSKVEEDEQAKQMARDDPKSAKKLANYGGPHTKTKALVASLLQSRAESEARPEQRPIKSVVFSGWTSHLDLIQIALDKQHIKYTRLDGQMSRPQRANALNTFRDDPATTVILVSIAAGGLGLNLTTANKVYVMEPQFNPAAEAQAIDRVHRLGQTREVTTVRFIMKGSFEEKMLVLQRKKQNLADLSMNKGKLDRSEAAKRRLEDLRSLFK
ncbi:MAG: hypothetical protein M1819_005327 [Sarea resinae]|nr:MAG: hypothetical protein M1819_005327 [Sarea resinae]